MNKYTKALIESLQSVGGHATLMANDLMLGRMTPEKQHEYANMLNELSELLHEHADLQGKGGADE